ncbi:MAG: ornithine cyclodeaminase family protein [Flavobacteriaceae bacterium]|nr:ornithine cyclodeaminase family protein [Flavobacteriaceae bacterium]
MENISLINGTFIKEHTIFKTLINALRENFSKTSIVVPQRHHHDFKNPSEKQDSTLLLMPAWNPSKEAGVKIITISPNNGKHKLPAIQGTYIYLDAQLGHVKAILDAKELTVKRTAAASALASSYLSKENASKLLMIGTGALSSNLILAHASIRPIKEVFIWGRSLEKSIRICEQLKEAPFTCTPVTSIKDTAPNMDIISCATLSESPLILGDFIQAGTHIDLVGAYKPTMREADNDLIKKANVYVDTFDGGMRESGDIVLPLKDHIISKTDILGDLFSLCKTDKFVRKNKREITVFKSVGHALEDLTAATYYYNKYMEQQ